MPFTKGHKLATGRPKGVKNKATITKEQLREKFHNSVMNEWDLLLKAQLKDSKKNYKARHYTFDQTIGKPSETVKVEGDISLRIDA